MTSTNIYFLEDKTEEGLEEIGDERERKKVHFQVIKRKYKRRALHTHSTIASIIDGMVDKSIVSENGAEYRLIHRVSSQTII